MSHDDPEPTENHSLRGALSALLGSFGIERVDLHDRVVACAERILTERGHRFDTVTVRYEALVVEASPAAARLLSADRDVVLSLLDDASPGSVDSMHIVSVAGRARRSVR